ncbi:MAG: zinc ABC transporter substrate-binding protein [Desulfococcaceae bacterium]|jgi:manganese/iron transport system substrate-binding protein|nr:zinc ABC transporter substrate-binding protein [Desulfococcaceae bacterium]
MKKCAFCLILMLFIMVSNVFAVEASAKKTVLVCSTTQIADFARQVAGDRCEVKCILAPGADPHTYMPTPDDVRMVLEADLALENGLHLEGKNWMATLAKDAGKPLLTCTEGIDALETESSGEKTADPHAWFSPRNAAVYVNNILKALIRTDPDGKMHYEACAKLYLQQLRVLDAWIREYVNRIPPARRVLVTSHDAFNYFCREYRFNADHHFLSLAPVGWSTGSEVGAGMTPERRKKVVNSIRSYKTPAVFVESSVNPKLIREIARDAGIRVGGQLYSDSMGEKDTAGETYIGMMRENVLTILEALAEQP